MRETLVTGMNRIVRTTLLVVVAIAIIAVAVIATAIHVISRNACARETILLAKDSGGRSVVYEFEACTTRVAEIGAGASRRGNGPQS